MTYILRLAVASDLDALRRLDREAFPTGRPDREPAHPGEIEGGLEGGQFTVAVLADEVVGMIQVERTAPDQVYLAALAVATAHQKTGLGRKLVQSMLDEVAGEEPLPAIVTVTSPLNVPMIRLMTSMDFVIVRGLRDYFGPGKHRVYLQHRSFRPVVAPDDRILLPVEAVDPLFDALDAEENVVTGVRRSVQGDMFEISRLRAADQGLMADEASISVSESGAVVAALTFLLGFSFTIPDYSEELRVLILVGTILTAGSLQVYANASGALARIRDGSFENHMKWGNLLLEFGGLYPLVIVLPAVFVQASASAALSITTGALVAAMILAYEYSPFSVSGRYSRGFTFHLLVVLTALLPLAAAPVVIYTGSDLFWVIAVAVVLGLRIMWLAPADKKEVGRRHRPGRKARAKV